MRRYEQYYAAQLNEEQVSTAEASNSTAEDKQLPSRTDLNSNDHDKSVFISYAHEDHKDVRRLYSELKDKGLEPWLDKESILPGQIWRDEIKKAIKNSRYFIPILSSNSVERGGYVKKGLKEDLDILDKMSYSKIFVIPVRLDECKVSDEKIKMLHIVDLFPDWKQGFKKVLRTMVLVMI